MPVTSFVMSIVKLVPGLGAAGAIAIAAYLGTLWGPVSHAGISPLTLSILVGVLLGNLRPALGQGTWLPGLRLAQKNLLRIGVALYGFNLNFFQIAEVGRRGLMIDVLMLSSTLALGYWLGTRWLKLDRQQALLIAAGSAICGAAAVVATVSVLRMSDDERIGKASTAVATVVLFGTMAMFLYPLLFGWLGENRVSFGVFVGSTVHEVAQVVAIGNAIGGEVANGAVITKMIRVLLLIPFLLALSFGTSRRQADGEKQPIAIPWFALLFALFAGLNSTFEIPEPMLSALRQVGVASLTVAMAAFGMETTLGRMRQAGPKPLLLGAVLFVYLVGIGGWISLRGN